MCLFCKYSYFFLAGVYVKILVVILGDFYIWLQEPSQKDSTMYFC